MISITSLKRRVNAFWEVVIGKPGDFELRARIFHSVCFIVGVAIFYTIPVNFAIDLPVVGLESVVLFAIICSLYYYSRVKRRVSTSITLWLFATNFAFAVNYFINSGRSGPGDLLFMLSLVITLTLSRVEHYKYWIPLNVILTLGLYFVEYIRPDLVPNTYTSRFYQFADISAASVMVMLLCFYCISYIRSHYESERKSAEAKSNAIEEQNGRILKQNLELQRLNAEKNKLMSIVAHDLRSPLGSIQNFLELLTNVDLESEEKQFIEKELLQTTIKTSAMLSRLLSWSKSQITGISVFPEFHNFAALLEETLESEKSIASQKNITLKVDIDWSVNIYADGDMMELIVRNLLGNAIKFTPNGGEIRISTQKKPDECWLCIRDNGIGIPPEKQSEIFSLTAQSTYGTENEKGLGLGLLLCKEFIAAQSGRIWFESSPGSGTAFFISIPLFKGRSPEPEPVNIADFLVPETLSFSK
jgi:two-component system, sensor histidine kinase and response regulator